MELDPRRMKFRIGLFIIVLFWSFTGQSQSFEIYQGDTINMRDADNKRQGEWIFFGRMTKEPNYGPDDVVEEGQFVNNRKNGVWYKYFPNGNKKSEITYINGKPNGPYKIYYENGKIEEMGNWKNNRNVRDFKRWYSNGELQQEFVFNTRGKRNGEQKYYHENGQLMIVGTIKEGKEVGKFTEYYADGSVKAVKVYDEPGVINNEKSKLYEPSPTYVKKEQDKNVVIKEGNQTIIIEEADSSKQAPSAKNATQNEAAKKVTPFNGYGNHTLYNQNKQISQKGYFRNFKLIDGLYYRYDNDGILINIERYKDGKYVGDVPLDE